MKIELSDYITEAKHFKWSEALLLPSLNTYHIPSDVEIANIKALCLKLDKVRTLIGKPIKINCWIRPIFVKSTDPKHNGVNYNRLKNGAKSSTHIYGKAVDFRVDGMTIDEVMLLLKPKAAELELSFEENSIANKRNWCHAQDAKMSDGKYRVFKP